MKNIKEALEKYRDDNDGSHTSIDYTHGYHSGFDDTIDLLFPLVEALEYIGHSPTRDCKEPIARQALAELKKKLGAE